MVLVNMETVKVNVPHDEAAELRRIAADEDRTVTSLIRAAIREWLDRRTKQPQ